MDNPFSKIACAEVITQHLYLKPGMVVLDVGCGPGRVTIPVAKQVGNLGEVVAVDIQDGMLQRAREKARQENISNIRFVHAYIGEASLGCNQFDRVLLVSVLGEIPNQEAALKEIFYTLKPGGLLSVTEIIFDPHFQTHNTVSHIAGKVGFREKMFFGSCVAYTLNLEKPDSCGF